MPVRVSNLTAAIVVESIAVVVPVEAVPVAVVFITVPVITGRNRIGAAIGWASPIAVLPEPPRARVVPVAIHPRVARPRISRPIGDRRWSSVAVSAHADSNGNACFGEQ